MRDPRAREALRGELRECGGEDPIARPLGIADRSEDEALGAGGGWH